NDLSVQRGGNPVVGFHMANMLAATGFPGDALQMMQKVRTDGLDGPRVQWLAALCLEDLGRIDEAARALRTGLDTPERTPLLLALSQLPPTAVVEDSELRSRLESAVEACPGDDPQLAMLLYGL